MKGEVDELTRHNQEVLERDILAQQQADKLEKGLRILEYLSNQYKKTIEELEREREVNWQLKEKNTLLLPEPEAAKLLKELNSKP